MIYAFYQRLDDPLYGYEYGSRFFEQHESIRIIVKEDTISFPYSMELFEKWYIKDNVLVFNNKNMVILYQTTDIDCFKKYMNVYGLINCL